MLTTLQPPFKQMHIKQSIQRNKITDTKTQINIFQEKYQSLKTNDSSLWKITKNILKVNEQSTSLNGSNGQLVISDKDKADLLGNHLSKSFTTQA